MISLRPIVCAAMVALPIGTPSLAAQTPNPPIHLVVEAGRPLRVALDTRVVIRRPGQRVTGTLVAAVFAHDRIVVPAGTKVQGHVVRVEGATRKQRARAMLGGDFSPLRRALLQFDSLVFADGRTISIRTRVTEGTGLVATQVAGAAHASGVVARGREAAAREAKHAIAVIKAPRFYRCRIIHRFSFEAPSTVPSCCPRSSSARRPRSNGRLPARSRRPKAF
jgi:hypothetical protein